MKVPVTVCFCINIHSSQNMETTYISINKWIGRRNSECLHNLGSIAYNYQEEILLSMIKWMNLETMLRATVLFKNFHIIVCYILSIFSHTILSYQGCFFLIHYTVLALFSCNIYDFIHLYKMSNYNQGKPYNDFPRLCKLI